MSQMIRRVGAGALSRVASRLGALPSLYASSASCKTAVRHTPTTNAIFCSHTALTLNTSKRHFSTGSAAAGASDNSVPTLPALKYIEYTPDLDILALLKERGFISAMTANTARHFNSSIDVSQDSLNAAISASAKGEKVQLYAETESKPSLPTRRVIYAGFDPTSDCLHMGNLLVIIALMHFHKAGHTVLPLVGGATGMVGDPSGRSTERVLLDEAAVHANAEGIRNCLEKFLTASRSVTLPLSEEPNPNKDKIPAVSPVMVNNLDWYGPMSVVTFLRDVGKHFRVAGMLAKDSVKKRMETDDNTAGMSFTEFAYQTLQGYDFSLLKERYGCSVEIGGSDQWGNITAGIEYVHRTNSALMAEHEARVRAHTAEVQAIKKANKGKKIDEKDLPPAPTAPLLDDEAHGLTLPLLTTSSGAKFGKSAGNAIWLDSSKTSAYALYQYLLGTADADVCKLLKLFTSLTCDTVDEVYRRHMTLPDARMAQRLLAEEVVRVVHGDLGVRQAQVATQLLFPGKDTPQAVDAVSACATRYMGLTLDELLHSLVGVPRVDVPSTETRTHDLLSLVVTSGMCATKAEAKRLAAGGGLYVNNARVEAGEAGLQVREEDCILGRVALLRSGQKKHHLVVFA